MFGAFKLVAGRLIDRYGAASCGGIWSVARVKLAGGKAQFASGVGHSVLGDTLKRAGQGTKKKSLMQAPYRLKLETRTFKPVPVKSAAHEWCDRLQEADEKKGREGFLQKPRQSFEVKNSKSRQVTAIFWSSLSLSKLEI